MYGSVGNFPSGKNIMIPASYHKQKKSVPDRLYIQMWKKNITVVEENVGECLHHPEVDKEFLRHKTWIMKGENLIKGIY